jgi:hypothetical protein
MFEDNVLESRPHALEEVESPQTAPAVGRAPNAKSLNQRGRGASSRSKGRPRRKDRMAGSDRGRTAAGDQQKIPDQPPEAPPFGLRHRSDASRRGPGRRLRLSGLR